MVAVAAAFKYGPKLSKIGSPCPPSNAKAKTLTAFRFIFDPDPANESFTPQALKNPNRKWANAAEECCGMGLSLFDAEAAAKRLYVSLGKRYNVKKILGTHLASIAVVPTHGHCDKPERGHFNLHEFVGVDLSTAVVNKTAM